MKQKVWLLIGCLVLIGVFLFAVITVARMRPDSGAPIHWQGHETGYTNVTFGGNSR